MLDTTKPANYYLSHYQSNNGKKHTQYHSHTQALSVIVLAVENRFAKIPEKMPYQHYPMTQISSSLIDSLPIVENL